MDKFIKISEEEYNKLLDRSDFLDCLEGAGVDNWEGYADAQEMYDGEGEE